MLRELMFNENRPEPMLFKAALVMAITSCDRRLRQCFSVKNRRTYAFVKKSTKRRKLDIIKQRKLLHQNSARTNAEMSPKLKQCSRPL